MSPALYFARFATGQPKVSLMNQGRSLKDVIGPLVLHLARRNAVKLRIDQAGGLFGGILVTLPHAVQQQGELRWRARRRLLLLVLYHLAIVYSHAKGKGIPARRHEGVGGAGAFPADGTILLYIGHFIVHKNHFHVFVVVDLLRRQIDDLLRPSQTGHHFLSRLPEADRRRLGRWRRRRRYLRKRFLGRGGWRGAGDRKSGVEGKRGDVRG